MGRAIVALLRAINVGGHNRVPMAELRSLLAELGHPGARTYVQSGNVLLDTVADTARARSAFAVELRSAMAERFGVDEPVIVRTGRELASLAGRHPYLAAQSDPTRLHVVFLADAPTASAIERAIARPSPPDEFTIDGMEVFVHYPDGAGRSRLRLDFGVPATARNWRTVGALLEMM